MNNKQTVFLAKLEKVFDDLEQTILHEGSIREEIRQSGNDSK